MDIKDRVRDARSSLKLSQEALAIETGSQRTTVAGYENGISLPKAEFLRELSIKYGINPNWILTGEGEMYLQKGNKAIESLNGTGLRQLPVYSEADLPEGAFVVPVLDQHLCAGSGSQVPEEDASSALVRVPAYLSKYGDKVAALKVDGDSMYPTLSRGDMVVCDSCGWSGEGIYALRMSGSGFVKRLTKRPGKIVIISDNPKYPPQEELEESQDIQIIGRVHCAITKVE